MKRLPVIAALWIGFAAITTGEDAPLPPTADNGRLQDLERKMSAVRSLYLEFNQERHLKLFVEPLKSEGVLFIDRPDLIRWEMTSPYQSIMLGDGKSAAEFESVNGEWEKLKLGYSEALRQILGQIALLNQNKLEALTRDFTISLTASGSTAEMTLVPKNKDVRAMMASLQVRMPPDFSKTSEVVMNEPDGDFTRIIFTRERRNVIFPPGTFDQNNPLDLAAVRAAVGHVP